MDGYVLILRRTCAGGGGGKKTLEEGHSGGSGVGVLSAAAMPIPALLRPVCPLLNSSPLEAVSKRLAVLENGVV